MTPSRRKYPPMLLIAVLAWSATGPAASGDGRIPAADHRPGEILVRFRPGIRPGDILHQPDLLRLLPVSMRQKRISPLREDLLLLRLGPVPPAREQAVLQTLRRRPGVAAVSLNFRRRVSRRPDDPLYRRQWNLNNRGDNTPLVPGIPGADIGVEPLWESGAGGPGSVVAVLDTGIDYTHPDLAPNMWRNPLEIPGNGVDDDGNGYVDDVYGMDFAADNDGGNDADPMDRDGHGTHVAGIIAARGDNARGVAGILWHARLVAAKCVRPDGYLYLDDQLEACEYLVNLQRSGAADLVAVNCSFGSTSYSEVEEDSLRELAGEGVVILCAAGNGGDDDTGDDNDETPFFPASYDIPEIIAVAATGGDDELADFSNFGARSVDLAAPGDGVLSTVPRGSGRLAEVQSAAGVFTALGIEFSGSTTGVTANIVPCGRGLAAADFPPRVAGAVALLERGEATFREKVLRAAGAGARAAVIYNNAAGNFSGTLQQPGNYIPAVSLARKDGLTLLTLADTPVTVISARADYDYKSGTSMAAPHAAGALALLACLNGRESADRRVARLLLATRPLPQLRDRLARGGRLDLTAAALVQPPMAVTARLQRNESLLQTEYLATVTWRPNPANRRHGVSGYLVFQSRPVFRELARVGSGTGEYRLRRVSRKEDLVLGVAALDAEGRAGAPAFAAAADGSTP